MTGLTKERFEQHLKQQLGKQTKELKAFAKEQTEELAGIVSGGFADVTERFGKSDGRLDILEQGQEEIKLRLDNMAAKFEVKELQKQMERVERKVGI